MTNTTTKNKPKSKTKPKAPPKPRAKQPRAVKAPTKPRHKVIQEIAGQFEADLNKTLPIAIQPDGSVVYKKYIIRQTSLGNWGVYNIQSRDMVDQYYLKTSALMAAKAYMSANLTKFFEIKRLDTKYWASFSDLQTYKHNIKLAKDFDRFQILLNKLEHSQFQTEHFKEEISKMFRWSFV
jgi:hypothetical protein